MYGKDAFIFVLYECIHVFLLLALRLSCDFSDERVGEDGPEEHRSNTGGSETETDFVSELNTNIDSDKRLSVVAMESTLHR